MMSNIENLNDSISDLTIKVENIKAKISKLILDLPDNPRINRLDHGCFTAKFSDMNESLSPFYHDFKKQYQAIVEIISETEIKDIVKVLLKLTKPNQFGAYWYRSYKRGGLRFHPDVIENIRSVLY